MHRDRRFTSFEVELAQGFAEEFGDAGCRQVEDDGGLAVGVSTKFA